MSTNHCYKIGTPEDDISPTYNEFRNDFFDDVWFSVAGGFVLNTLKQCFIFP
jgi:hypothetical protein